MKSWFKSHQCLVLNLSIVVLECIWIFLSRARLCHSSVRVWDCRERQTLRTDHRHHTLAAQNKPQAEHTLPMVVALEGKWDNQDIHPSFPLRALSTSQRPADVLFGPCVYVFPLVGCVLPQRSIMFRFDEAPWRWRRRETRKNTCHCTHLTNLTPLNVCARGSEGKLNEETRDLVVVCCVLVSLSVGAGERVCQHCRVVPWFNAPGWFFGCCHGWVFREVVAHAKHLEC